jgi:LysM repeat protein
MIATRLLPLAVACALLSACQNGQNSQGSLSGVDPYVSNYGNDGGYNPYSDQPQTSGYETPSYTQAPAPAEADPYAFNAPSSPAPKKTASAPAKKPASSVKKPASSGSRVAASKKPAARQGGSYKVGKGDTLYGIARARGTTVAKIKSANKLTSDIIRPGQVLKIP